MFLPLEIPVVTAFETAVNKVNDEKKESQDVADHRVTMPEVKRKMPSGICYALRKMPSPLC
jgi:hypothetical protein